MLDILGAAALPLIATTIKAAKVVPLMLVTPTTRCRSAPDGDVPSRVQSTNSQHGCPHGFVEPGLAHAAATVAVAPWAHEGHASAV